jgi:signal transduction histidine kinase
LMPHLFAPFRGRERPAGRHQGLGLGLFIADNIVRAHGGSIDVVSAQGATRFRVRLPRHRGSEPGSPR